MKKQIAIIFAAMLAALPVSANAQSKTDLCECVNYVQQEQALSADELLDKLFRGEKIKFNADYIEIIDKWLEEKCGECGGQIKPNAPVAPDESDKPEDSETPEIPETPDTPETPELWEKPSEPVTPETPQQPSSPIMPEQKPVMPDTEDGSDSQSSSYVSEVVRLVNAQRARYGLSALTSDSVLNKAAATRASETTQSFSHTRPNGESCFTVLDEYSYKYSHAGENIAMGQSSPSEVVNAWMNSQGHRENILKSSFTKIGVGCVSKGGKLYWAQMFAG